MQKPPLCFGNPSPPEFTSPRRLLQDSINGFGFTSLCATHSIYVCGSCLCTTRGLKGAGCEHMHMSNRFETNNSTTNKSQSHIVIGKGCRAATDGWAQAKRKHLHTKQLKTKRQDGYNRTRFTTYSTRIPRSERESDIRTTMVALRPSVVHVRAAV